MQGNVYRLSHPGLVLAFILFSICGRLYAQTAVKPDKVYEDVVRERAEKITLALAINDKAKATWLTDIIAQQYLKLNDIQTHRDAQLKEVKSGTGEAEIKTREIKKKADKKIAKLHKHYLAKLGSQLSPLEVVQVKDGMTYNVVPLTYTNYLLMLPYLKEEQQNKIKIFLTEARELAMDGGSSKEKHAWFGKYKGKITNYLTAEGYDLKKEGSNWAIRRNIKSDALEIIESNRVIKSLSIDGVATRESVRNLLAHQYQQIQAIQKERDEKMKTATETATVKEIGEKEASAIWAIYKTKLDDQRNLFIEKLSGFISLPQVEIVKNTMTDNGLQKEFEHFLALLPDLTEVQKKQVYQYLLEARDNAMNALKPKEREKWFIKYRGRANNYLAKQGYNLRKATEELEAKLIQQKDTQPAN